MFKDLLVIETAGVLAGPSVGMFFAELGARVIKVENARAGGDATRGWKLPSEDPRSPVSAYFSSVNWGKEHLMLDLKNEGDQAKFDSLIKDADVLISNHLPQDAAKLGLGRERLKKLNRKLIHGHISGYKNDPERPAYDVILQAEMGYISMTGNTGSLAKLPIAFIDILAGHQLKEGILVAMLERERSGTGRYVEASLEEAALSGLINQASNYLMAGTVAGPMGTLHPNIAPYGELFTCADGNRIVLAVGSDVQFNHLCAHLELKALINDERFANNRERVIDRKELWQLLNDRISGQNSTDLLNGLSTAGVPAGLVRSLDQVLESETAKELVLREKIDGVATMRIRGNVFTSMDQRHGHYPTL